MGKRKVVSEEELKDLVYLGPQQVVGFVSQLLGYDRVRVKCADGFERLCRIRGKRARSNSGKTSSGATLKAELTHSDNVGTFLCDGEKVCVP